MKAKLSSAHDSQAASHGSDAPSPSRREFMGGVLAGAVAGSLGCSLTSAAAAAEFRSLKDIAAQKGILFGSSVGARKPGMPASAYFDPQYMEILKKECSVIVPENELKSGTIARERDQYNFEPGDLIAGFAKSNGIKLRGHNLLWNKSEFTQKWLTEWLSEQTAQSAERYLRDYIKRVCTHYGDQIHSWDVVNETIEDKTGEVRDTPWTRLLGFDVLRIAYEAAREAAPHAQLVYNDYMSWNPRYTAFRGGVLKLLEKFKASKIPVDALGVQSHIKGDDIQHKEWKAFVDEVTGMGYGLLITEFDVNDKYMPADVKQRDAQVAAQARDYLDMMLSYRQINQVLCWGIVDKQSWLRYDKDQLRPDGEPQRPNPYDDSYQPKPMREAIAAALAAAPARA
jgi:endo-1,4-beta-xylanase